MVRQRARIRFRKQGDLRFIGHRSLVSLWERLLRRAEISLAMSQGFHPRPRINFPLALGLGIAGHGEIVEIEFLGDDDAASLARRIEPQMPQGLSLVGIEMLPATTPPAQVSSTTLELPILPAQREHLANRLEQLATQQHIWIERDAARRRLDLREQLLEARLAGDVLQVRLRHDRTGSVRPAELLAVFELGDEPSVALQWARTQVELVV